MSLCVAPSLTVQSAGLIVVPPNPKIVGGSDHSYFTIPKSSVEPRPESWNGCRPSTVCGSMAILATGAAPPATTTSCVVVTGWPPKSYTVSFTVYVPAPQKSCAGFRSIEVPPSPKSHTTFQIPRSSVEPVASQLECQHPFDASPSWSCVGPAIFATGGSFAFTVTGRLAALDWSALSNTVTVTV